MRRAPYCDWADVPLVLRIEDLARVLHCGVRTLRTWAQVAPWKVPTPLPRVGKTEPLAWRKTDVQRFLERGGGASRAPRLRQVS